MAPSFEGEFVDGGAFKGVVGAQVLAGGVEVGVAEEVLDGHDIAAALQEARCVGVAELVEVCVFDADAGGYVFQPAEHLVSAEALSVPAGEDPGGVLGELL